MNWTWAETPTHTQYCACHARFTIYVALHWKTDGKCFRLGLRTFCGHWFFSDWSEGAKDVAWSQRQTASKMKVTAHKTAQTLPDCTAKEHEKRPDEYWQHIFLVRWNQKQNSLDQLGSSIFWRWPGQDRHIDSTVLIGSVLRWPL